MVRIRSAVKQGQRPTAALLNDPNPQGSWTRIDYLLQDAYYIMDHEICTICNNPIWLCHSTDNRIDFEIKKRTCYAKAEIEDFEKDKVNNKLDSGEYIIASPIGIDDGEGNYEPLPNRREAYERLP